MQKIVAKDPLITKQTAIILGNGRSRLGLDINELKNYGTVFGCNGAYRDLDVDVLVATDPELITDIIMDGFITKKRCYFYHWQKVPARLRNSIEKQIEHPKGIVENNTDMPYFYAYGKDGILHITGVPEVNLVKDIKDAGCTDKYFTGPTAIDIAMNLCNGPYYFIGFDLYTEPDGKANDCYIGTKNYPWKEKENPLLAKTVVEVARILRGQGIMPGDGYPKCGPLIYRVVDEKCQRPKDWDNLVFTITKDEFVEKHLRKKGI